MLNYVPNPVKKERIGMVRRYKELIGEIQDKQKFSRIEWTQKVIDALQYTMEQLQAGRLLFDGAEKIIYEEWREWQETLAKEYGFSETTDTPPDYSKREGQWMKIPPARFDSQPVKRPSASKTRNTS